MKNTKLITLFTLLMVACVVKAQTSLVVKEIKREKFPFKVETRTDDMLPEIIFDDGRVAQVVVATMPAQLLDIGMDVVESHCGKNIPTKCSITYPVSNNELKLVWKSHPDAKKIGKPVVNKNNQEILNETLSFSFSDKRKYEKFYKEVGMKDPEFSCPKWDWLDTKGDKIQLLEWSSEIMLTNPETDINENRTFMAVMDIALRKKNKNTYAVEYPKKTINSGFDDGGFILVFGDVVGWTVQQPRNESCDVSLKPNFASAIAKFNEIKYSEPKPLFKSSPFWEKLKNQNSSNFETLKYLAGHEDLIYLQQIKLVSTVFIKDAQNNNIISATPTEIE